MWLLTAAFAGIPNACAPPAVLPFLEEHIAVGEYLRSGNHPISVEQVTHDSDTVLLWVRCMALMGEMNQLVAWKKGNAPMEAVGLGFRGPGLDRWFEDVQLSVAEVAWPDTTAVQVSGTFARRTEHHALHSEEMVVWVVGYPALDERRRFGDIGKGPRHGEGCPERGLPDGHQTEVWMARSGHSTAQKGWHAEATVTTTHTWRNGALELEERWAPAGDSPHPTVVHRTLGWQYGGLHEGCRTE